MDDDLIGNGIFVTAEKRTDLELIKRIIEGECDLFEHLVVRYRRLCMSYVFRMVRNQHDSEDLVQETFVKAYSALHQFSAKGKFSSWLMKIAHNVCMAFFNRRKNYKIDSYVEVEKLQTVEKNPSQNNPLELTIKSEFINSVNRAISQLPPIHKSCIMLRYMIELSYTDIAEILDIPVGTVKSRISEARKKLKGSVNNYEV